MKPLKHFLQPGGDILEEFGPADVRTLLHAEEELSQVCSYFQMTPLLVYKNHKTTSARNGKESSPPLIICFTIFFQTLGEQNSERTFQFKHFGYLECI